MPDQPTPAPWTVEQVRRDAYSMRDIGVPSYERIADMLDAYAERLEDDDRKRAIASNLLARLSDCVTDMRRLVTPDARAAKE